MGKGLKPSWTSIFGIVIQLFFASVLATSEIAFRKDGMDPNYASLLKECKKIKLPDGTMIQTVPKLLQTPLVTACSTWKSKYGPPLRQAVCRFPDCLSNPCQYGWCEETLQGYQCLCFPGFRGKQCAERWTLPADGTTVSSSDSSQSATSPTSTSGLPFTTASTAPTDTTTITPSESTLQGTSATSTSGSPLTTVSSGSVDTNTISTSDPESPSTTTSTVGVTATTPSTAPTDAMTITPSESTLQGTPATSTSGSPLTTESTAATDSTSVTPSGSTLQSTFPASTSGPTTTAALTAPTDAMTITPSDSTLQATSPTSTSSPTTSTGYSTPTDATTITPSDSTLPVTSPTSTSGPPMTTGSSAKVFVTDSGAHAIFVSEIGDTLNFTSIPSSSNPRYIKYDPTERNIYLSDWNKYCVYRSNLDGEDRERVTAAGSNRPNGIAIAERSRILYIGYLTAQKVTSMSIERGSPLPGTETDFVNQDISYPRALIIDEEEGFLYISHYRGIVRALLNATNDIEEIYHNTDLRYLSGLSIDLTRHPRRIFFCDDFKKKTFYKELSTSTAVELTEYTHNPYQETLIDVRYFNSTLYWVKANDPKGIGIMTNYDQTNRSYRVQEISQFQYPQGILITFVDP